MYLSVIMLKVNGLNVPIRRHRMDDWLKKSSPYISCLLKTHFREKDRHRLKVRDGKSYSMQMETERKLG